MTAPRGEVDHVKSGGFTLIELLIAIMITGLAFTGLFAAMHTGVNVQVYVREMGDAERVGPAILSQISEDLRNLYFYNIEHNAMFEGRAFQTGEARMDQLHFYTTRSSLVADPAIDPDPEHPVHSPITEVGWMCKESPEEGFWELHRREEPFGDDDVTSGGYIRMVSDRILLFKVQYTGWDFGPSNPDLVDDRSVKSKDAPQPGSNPFGNAPTASSQDPNDPDAEDEDATLVWEDDWSSQEKGSAPVAIKIELVVAPDVDPSVVKRLERAGRLDELEKSYVHVVILPQFREEDFLVSETYAWDGKVAEPAFQDTGAGGPAAGPGGSRNGNASTGAAGGRGGTQSGSSNPFGAGSSSSAGGSQSPFLNALRGNNR